MSAAEKLDSRPKGGPVRQVPNNRPRRVGRPPNPNKPETTKASVTIETNALDKFLDNHKTTSLASAMRKSNKAHKEDKKRKKVFEAMPDIVHRKI